MVKKPSTPAIALAALGIVFGDIGTSPLYAFRETLDSLPIDEADIFGVLSLIFWSLILIISIKYLLIVFRADNDGEGGGLALLALLKQRASKHEHLLYIIAIFGAGLLLGDAMLTPAISVTSAIEGLDMFSSDFQGLSTLISCAILLILFSVQSKGTGVIGAAFGPILLIWFIVLAVLGIAAIVQYPRIFYAINPYYAYAFFQANGIKAYLLLGSVFLVVTGGEALYADIGHFGKNPIRLSWFTVVLPSLVLNYFGQGANLFVHPEAIVNPFYLLAPNWFFIPLIILSTMATVIASQAVITATFSLTKQAVLLGLYPRLQIIQTSPSHPGQIYIPQVNFFLMIGTLILLFTFKDSTGLADAYGIAVNLVMLSVTVMVAYAARLIWNWPMWQIIGVFSWFILIELFFFGANLHKFETGGWAPVSFALVVAFIMYTWNAGMLKLKKNFYMKESEFKRVLKQLNFRSLNQLQGLTAIFMTDAYDSSGGSFLHFLKLSRAVPEHIIILSYVVENKPRVPRAKRFEIQKLGDRLLQLTLHYGFMDTVSIPHALSVLSKQKVLDFSLNVENATYFVEIPNIMASKKVKTMTFYWQEKWFAFLMRNYSANLNIEFFQLPYNRTVAIGTYYII